MANCKDCVYYRDLSTEEQDQIRAKDYAVGGWDWSGECTRRNILLDNEFIGHMSDACKRDGRYQPKSPECIKKWDRRLNADTE